MPRTKQKQTNKELNAEEFTTIKTDSNLIGFSVDLIETNNQNEVYQQQSNNYESYEEFLIAKTKLEYKEGFILEENASLNHCLFPFQRDIVKILLERGRSCCFAQTGLGKTRIQISFAHYINEYYQKKGEKVKIIIFAPLAVTQQTIEEASKLNVKIVYCHDQKEVEQSDSNITITNYERIEKFDSDYFNATILDESSIIKGYDSSTRKLLNDFSIGHKYKLALSATPAPNDYIELLNHAEWLGILSIKEAISLFFIQDGNRSNKYRLKNYAVKDFWQWVSSWSIAINKPSDINSDYDDSLYNLPELIIKQDYLEENEEVTVDQLFFNEKHLKGINEEREFRKETILKRVDKTIEIINNYSENTPVLIWCELNDENDILLKELTKLGETKENISYKYYVKDIKGGHSSEEKEKRLVSFSHNETKILITKPSIAGFGLNWQHCNVMIFVGLSHSFEKSYQAIRRCWRFGQQKDVIVHFVQSKREANIKTNYKKKEDEYKIMMNELVKLIESSRYNKNKYNPTQIMQLPLFLS